MNIIKRPDIHPTLLTSRCYLSLIWQKWFNLYNGGNWLRDVGFNHRHPLEAELWQKVINGIRKD